MKIINRYSPTVILAEARIQQTDETERYLLCNVARDENFLFLVEVKIQIITYLTSHVLLGPRVREDGGTFLFK